MEGHDEIAEMTMRSMPMADPKAVAAAQKEAERLKKEEIAREKEELRKIKQLEKEFPTSEQEAATTTAPKRTVAAAAAQPTKAQSAAAAMKQMHDDNFKSSLYFARLKHKLKNVKQPKTMPKTPEEAAALRYSIEMELQGEGGIAQASSMALMAVGGVEQLSRVWNPLGLQLTGPAISLSQAVQQQQDEWNDLVTEFAIEHHTWFMHSAARRLLVFVVRAAVAVDTINKTVGARVPDARPKDKEEASNLPPV